MDQIQSLYDNLQADPENWDLRMHLIETLVQQGNSDNAHQVLSESPAIPEQAHGALANWGLIELPDAGAEAAQAVIPVEEVTEDFAQPVVVSELVEPVIPVESLERTSAQDITRIAPLVDPEAVPSAAKLHLENTGDHGHLNYVHGEDLSHSRKHLAVYSGDGTPIDADLLNEHELDEFGENHEHVIMVAEGGYIPHGAKADDTKEKVGALLTTVLVHVAIALLLWVLVISIPEPKAPEIVATTMPANTENKVTKRQLARAVQKTPSAPSNQSVAVITAATSSNVSAPTIEFTETNETVELGSSFGAGLGFGGAGSGFGGGFAVPAAMKSRCSSAERSRMRQKHGGSQLGDQRIGKALKFLKSVQNDDGSWGDGKYNAAMTGLSLLSYLGYCVTPDHPEYGETVMKGIMYLVEFYQNDKRLYATSADHGAAYEHGIATYALGETYAIARLGKRKLPGMKEAFEQGVQTIIDGQNPDGGWSYGYPARGNSDTSVTGWQYQALKAAKHTKLKFSGLSTSIKKAQQYLDDIQDRNNGMFPYRPGSPGKASLAGAGVLGLQMLGGSGYKDEITKGLDAIIGGIKGKKWQGANLYEWYYNTQATFEGGGDHWKQWNKMFQDEIIKNQNADGSWRGGRQVGGGNIYATCLCTLMLEVYYRYLPAASN